MCWVCEKYGNGEKWYLNPENYARRLYKVRKEGKESAGADADPQAAGMGAGVVAELVKARISGDQEWEDEIKRDALEQAYQTHFGQVVTLDEYLQILDIAYPLAKMTCGCRRVQRGMPDEENFTCMGIGSGMYKWERWPETVSWRGRVCHPRRGQRMGHDEPQRRTGADGRCIWYALYWGTVPMRVSWVRCGSQPD